MVIHSVVSPDVLLSLPEAPVRSIRPWNNGWVEGYEQNGAFHIQRIISTDLADYLDSKLNPGQILPYKQERINQ